MSQRHRRRSTLRTPPPLPRCAGASPRRVAHRVSPSPSLCLSPCLSGTGGVRRCVRRHRCRAAQVPAHAGSPTVSHRLPHCLSHLVPLAVSLCVSLIVSPSPSGARPRYPQSRVQTPTPRTPQPTTPATPAGSATPHHDHPRPPPGPPCGWACGHPPARRTTERESGRRPAVGVTVRALSYVKHPLKPLLNCTEPYWDPTEVPN